MMTKISEVNVPISSHLPATNGDSITSDLAKSAADRHRPVIVAEPSANDEVAAPSSVMVTDADAWGSAASISPSQTAAAMTSRGHITSSGFNGDTTTTATIFPPMPSGRNVIGNSADSNRVSGMVAEILKALEAPLTRPPTNPLQHPRQDPPPRTPSMSIGVLTAELAKMRPDLLEDFRRILEMEEIRRTGRKQEKEERRKRRRRKEEAMTGRGREHQREKETNGRKEGEIWMAKEEEKLGGEREIEENERRQERERKGNWELREEKRRKRSHSGERDDPSCFSRRRPDHGTGDLVATVAAQGAEERAAASSPSKETKPSAAPPWETAPSSSNSASFAEAAAMYEGKERQMATTFLQNQIGKEDESGAFTAEDVEEEIVDVVADSVLPPFSSHALSFHPPTNAPISSARWPLAHPAHPEVSSGALAEGHTLIEGLTASGLRAGNGQKSTRRAEKVGRDRVTTGELILFFFRNIEP